MNPALSFQHVQLHQLVKQLHIEIVICQQIAKVAIDENYLLGYIVTIFAFLIASYVTYKTVDNYQKKKDRKEIREKLVDLVVEYSNYRRLR